MDSANFTFTWLTTGDEKSTQTITWNGMSTLFV